MFKLGVIYSLPHIVSPGILACRLVHCVAVVNLWSTPGLPQCCY